MGARIDAGARVWRTRLGHVAIEGPPELQRLAATLRTSLAHMLLSRDGPALRPGTRSYARTWIRDGAMMAAAVLMTLPLVLAFLVGGLVVAFGVGLIILARRLGLVDALSRLSFGRKRRRTRGASRRSGRSSP